MLRKMTDEEKELVEKNLKLAYSAVYKTYTPHIEQEDAMQIASFGLCKAAMNYDSSLGYTFSTFAITVIRNELLMQEKRFKPTRIVRSWVSYDQNTALKNSLASDKEPFDDMTPLLDEFRSTLTERDKAVFDMCIIGDKTQTEAGNILSFNQGYVSRLCKRIRSELAAYLRKENVDVIY